MANWNNIAKGLGLVAAVVCVGAGWRAWQTFDTSRSAGADNSVRLADFKATDQAAITRGQYVMRTADCAACHSANFAGGYKIDTPFGSLATSNITPDAKTGIGDMTERGFFNALRQGIGSHGLLYPAMPYTAYTRMADSDLHDLWAFLSTIKPVDKAVDENAGMKFPYNIRLAMAGWDLLYFDNRPLVTDTEQSAQWNRGRYLTEGPAHCSTCHTPRDALGGEKTGQFLMGAQLGTWYAPDITPNPHTGIGNWSQDNLVSYLKTGSDDHAVAAGPMAEAVEHSFQHYTREDLAAISEYLQTLEPSKGLGPQPMAQDTPAVKNAALTYEVNCSACHGLQGEGIKGMVTAFAGNQRIVDDNPSNLIHALLLGARAPHTETRQTAAGMPSFAWKMNDREIADILNYVRNSWGNGAQAVKPEQVEAMRKVSGAVEKLKTPAG